MAEPPATPPSRCWVVQPNFDVIVYFDRATASRLAFIERVAARQPSPGATTLYRLSRDTIYAALESGLEASVLLDTLAAGAEYALPDNVTRTLRDWAARRERLTVYARVDLLEFADAARRDAALAAQRVHGTAVGERFVLLARPADRQAMAPTLSHTVDYHAAPGRCLRLAEDGTVAMIPGQTDLLVPGELASWAEPPAAKAPFRRLTHQSIQRAVQAGWTAERILEGLSTRTSDGVSPILSIAIRAWAGLCPCQRPRPWARH